MKLSSSFAIISPEVSIELGLVLNQFNSYKMH